MRQDEPLDFLDVPTAAAAEKAKDDVRFCDGGGCNRQAAKYKLVAAVGPGKQQPGILSSKKLPRPLNGFNYLAFRGFFHAVAV